MVHIADFIDSATGRINWETYYAAQVFSGERCQDCGEPIFTVPIEGKRVSCPACLSLSKPWAVHHKRRVRCPHCMAIFEASAEMGALPEGENLMICDSCGKKFSVEVHHETIFRSPMVVGDPQRVGPTP